MKRFALGIALLAAAATPVLADVTITAAQTGKAMGRGGDAQSITHIKGARMRNDIRIGDEVISSIIDVDAQKMIVLNSKKREAEIYDMQKIGDDVEKNVGAAEARVSFTPNGQTREILGKACAGYDVSIVTATQPGSETAMSIKLAGPAWIAKGVPGTDDYAAFFKAAVQKGYFFTSPQAAKAQPAQAKNMAEMYRNIIAMGGIPYAQDIAITFEGGPMAGMMNKIGGMNIQTTVTNVSTSPIPDDVFAVPAGYKTKIK